MPPSRPDDVDWLLALREPTIADLVRDTEASDPHAELLARYEALRRAEQSAGVGVWDIDVARDTVTGTTQFFRIMGLEPTAEPVPMEVLRSLRFAEDRGRVNDGYHDAVVTRVDVYENEYRIRRPDGQVRWIWGRGRVIRDRSGQAVRYSGADIDVTERKATEQALAESESRLRIAVEAADLGIWDWNVLTNEMTWSDRAKVMAGFPTDAPVSFEMVSQATHPEDLPRTSEMARRALDPAIRSNEAYEYRIRRPDGSTRWVVAHGEAVFAEIDGREQAVRYTGTIQDITQRKHAETQLRESETRLRLAIDAARLGIWAYDATSRTVQSTPELNRILGFPEDQPLDVDGIEARYHPGEQERLRAASQSALAAGERHVQFEYRYVWPDQTIRWHFLRAEILFSNDGAVSGALGILMDITEQKETEEHRQMLVRELQHRVNNTLALVSAIANQTFRLHRGRDTAAAVAAFSNRISALGQAHTILTHESWRDADMDEIVNGALAPYREGGRINVSGPGVRLASRRALSLALALNELATNAAKYGALSSDEGRVEVEWWIDDQQSDTRRLHLRWSESRGPKVSVPKRTSFGTRLIRDMLSADFNGEVELQYLPTGVVCTLVAPLT
jgi:PAS domain S-box-containing protein